MLPSVKERRRPRNLMLSVSGKPSLPLRVRIRFWQRCQFHISRTWSRGLLKLCGVLLILYAFGGGNLLGSFYGYYFVDEVGSLDEFFGCVASCEDYVCAFGHEVEECEYVVYV